MPLQLSTASFASAYPRLEINQATPIGTSTRPANASSAAFKSQRVEKNVARVDALQFPVLEFDEEDARQAGEVRAHLASKGMPIGPYEVLIAGQAKARNLTLVTHNTAECQRIPGLRVEDWSGKASPAASKARKAWVKPRSG